MRSVPIYGDHLLHDDEVRAWYALYGQRSGNVRPIPAMWWDKGGNAYTFPRLVP